MLIDPKSKPMPGDAAPGGGAAQDDKRAPPPRRAAMALLLVLAALLGAAAYRLAFDSPGFSEPSPVVTKAVRPLIRAGDTVTLPEGSPLRSELTIAPVTAKDSKRDLVLPAVVETDPARLIKVAPPLAGRVAQLKVGLGERVEAGQPLVVIDSPDLGTAYSDYDRAKVLLSLASKTRDRLRELQKIGGAAMKDLQQAETDYVTAEVELQRATAHLKQIGVEPDAGDKTRTVTVVAPMAGSITDLGVAPGEYWNDPTAAMMTVADLKTVWVTASVPEKDTALVAKGQSVAVVFAAYPGEVFTGHVLFVSDVLDPTTRRTKVTIAFDNPGTRLRPGMFASVTFYAPVQRVPVVPTSALVLKDDATQIFVETAPWTFEAHDVDIGFQQGSEAALTRGVKVGDRIVVRGGALLGD
ncbi:MAG TPA: efflux RND transporter periplasmic adaptor subunit [Xanthobacteraceae bacterium]|nr:efflux RND transporter periplasmic adaptor subunit [Xanthobacteraceae bacterium]